MTIHCASEQRKNAAIKLQHSGLATLVVYHIRHRVVHHIDNEIAFGGSDVARTVETGFTRPVSYLERGPDFAEPDPRAARNCLCDVHHTAHH
jgi:hypothetical protein